MEAPRILYVVTHAVTARHLLRGQLARVRGDGYDVALAADGNLAPVAEREGVRPVHVPMSRVIDPVGDVRAVVRLHRFMRRWRPAIVNAGTPKAGLLGMVAARAAGVPVRIYTLRGLRSEGTRGLRRTILRAAERVASGCAHEIVAVGPSLAERYTSEGLAPREKVRVLARGSSNGVDVERFAGPDPGAAAGLRTRLDLPEGRRVVGFVGRLTRDKGIVELTEAFDRVREEQPDTRLLVVGDFEAGDAVPSETVRRIREDPAIVHTGFVADTAPYYALMDVLAFPSRREGFPNVPLEAGAAGVPVVAFRATGTVDAVVDGETGTLVARGDVEGLAGGIVAYLEDAALRTRHGRAGRARARRNFRRERVWAALLEEYRRLLAESGAGEMPRGAPDQTTSSPGSSR